MPDPEPVAAGGHGIDPALPEAALRPCSGVSTTTTQATIWSWMLQPRTAMPGLSNTTGVFGTPA